MPIYIETSQKRSLRPKVDRCFGWGTNTTTTIQQQNPFLSTKTWKGLHRYFMFMYRPPTYVHLVFIDTDLAFMSTNLSQKFSFLVLDSSFRIGDDRLLRRISTPSLVAWVRSAVLAMVVEVLIFFRWRWTGSTAAPCSSVCRAVPCVEEWPNALAGRSSQPALPLSVLDLRISWVSSRFVFLVRRRRPSDLETPSSVYSGTTCLPFKSSTSFPSWHEVTSLRVIGVAFESATH